MAKTTSFISFPFFRDYGAKEKKEDALGYFTLKIATAKFLDIDKVPREAAVGKITRRKKSTKIRDLTLIDGTVLNKRTNSEETGGDTPILGAITTGGKSIQLRSGKITTNGNYKMMSIRFPVFATNLNISDALGSIIPSGKISGDPSATEIFNYFISKGGSRYPILTREAAEAEKSAEAPTTRAAAKRLNKNADTTIVDAQ
jgi:hypothetical protein